MRPGRRKRPNAPAIAGDLTILSGDLLAATPDQIRAMTVIATIVDGEAVHCGDLAVCGTLVGSR